MRESSDTTKCVTMLRHLAGTIILILFGISCAEQRSWTEVTFEHDSYIKVPLTINGDVHWYIFDTGAGVSTILSELAVKKRILSGVFPFQRCWCLFVLEKKIFQR